MGSPAESMALAIAPKFTAILSIFGSLLIILKVLFNESRRKKTMHRIVLGMSSCDILASIWYFTGTWAIPAGTLSWYGDGETETIYWAAGDADGISCSFAGFFNQFAVATPLYNATLSWYYLLVINYGWSDRRVEKIEWVFHIIPIGYAVITSTFAVAANLYGHVEWTCWILPAEVFDDTQELTPIQNNFRWIQWIFLFGVVWVCIVVVTIIFIVLYHKMKSMEKVMSRYTYSTTTTASVSAKTRSGSKEGQSRIVSTGEDGGSTDLNMNTRAHRAREVAKSKKIAVQGMLYIGAFYLSWLFPTITRITELIAGRSYFPIQFLDTVLVPLQGFLNLIIYIRPRYSKLRGDNEEDGFWKTFMIAVTEIKID